MNGLGLPPEPTPLDELRAQVAMAEACAPIEQAHQDAKKAYAAACETGNLDEIRAASRVKNDAAVHLNDTRTWLRREKRIAKLQAQIPALEQRLAGKVIDPETGKESTKLRLELGELLAGMREELPALEAEASPLRELFGSEPGAVVITMDDGSASADGLPVTVKASAKTGRV